MSTETTVLRISLPSDLVAHFEVQAFLADNQAIEQYIASHIARTREFVGGEGEMYLTPAEAKEMRQILGGRINTPEKLLDMLRRLMTWKVGGAKVELTTEQQQAVVWWAKSAQIRLEDAIPQLTKQALGLLLKC